MKEREGVRERGRGVGGDGGEAGGKRERKRYALRRERGSLKRPANKING